MLSVIIEIEHAFIVHSFSTMDAMDVVLDPVLHIRFLKLTVNINRVDIEYIGT